MKEYFVRGDEYHYTIYFGEEKIRIMTDRWGLGRETWENVCNRRELSDEITEQKTFGYRASGPLRSGIIYFIVALLVFIFAEGSLRYISAPFGLLFILSLSLTVCRLKAITWVNLIRKDGSRLTAIPFTKTQDSQRIEFIEALRDYLPKPNQPEQATRSARP